MRGWKWKIKSKISLEIFPPDCEPGHLAASWQQWTNLAVLGVSAGAFLCSEAGGRKAAVCVDSPPSHLQMKTPLGQGGRLQRSQ